MRISVAMATYNGAKYLQDQLDSFLNQTQQPDELVVCDDGSTDATLKILEIFSQRAPFAVIIYRNVKNLGHTRNFEKALSLCSGDLIFLSDQDDVWDSEKISVALDCFVKNPGIDVVINDAHYTDEKLNRSGVTVLEKVLSVGGDKSGHIAGACTALTKRFRNFVLPFPKDNCPQHDVYIHRWANLVGSKLVIQTTLQVWRIHCSNSTSDNEMSQPEIISPLSRYMRTKDLDATDSYIKKADEFREMNAMLDERNRYLSCLPMAQEIDTMRSNINQIIDANMNRSKLMKSGWLARKQFVFRMMLSGQYRHFKGLKSIAKDLLR